MIVDAATETETLKLRDAFRVMAWKFWQHNEIDLNDRYTRFYTRWNKSSIRSMDLGQLTQLATEKGFANEQLLLMREIYYGIQQENHSD